MDLYLVVVEELVVEVAVRQPERLLWYNMSLYRAIGNHYQNNERTDRLVPRK